MLGNFIYSASHLSVHSFAAYISTNVFFSPFATYICTHACTTKLEDYSGICIDIISREWYENNILYVCMNVGWLVLLKR